MQRKVLKHTCRICGESVKYISRHLKYKHSIDSLKLYYDRHILQTQCDCICKECGNPTRFLNSVNVGYAQFCSNHCQTTYFNRKKCGIPRTEYTKLLISQRRKQFLKTRKGREQIHNLSINRRGINNSIHKQTQETRNRCRQRQSDTMRGKILRGEFTPPITNSWCRSRTVINGIPFRSRWEAAFHILNPQLLFETTRIPYTDTTGKTRTYIVDFTDNLNRVLYEIKPNATKNTSNNTAKRQAALNWCTANKFYYKEINDEYFMYNANRIDYSQYSKKIYESMKQFIS